MATFTNVHQPYEKEGKGSSCLFFFIIILIGDVSKHVPDFISVSLCYAQKKNLERRIKYEEVMWIINFFYPFLLLLFRFMTKGNFVINILHAWVLDRFTTFRQKWNWVYKWPFTHHLHSFIDWLAGWLCYVVCVMRSAITKADSCLTIKLTNEDKSLFSFKQ